MGLVFRRPPGREVYPGFTCPLLSHLASLALATGPGGEITDIYSYFIISSIL